MRAFGFVIAASVVSLLGIIGIAGGLQGELEAELSLLPYLSLDSSLELSYGFGAGTVSSFTQFSLGTWVWQEFSGEGSFGPLSWEAHLLFGPSTVDFLYDELVLRTSFAGLELGLYAAQLSDAVLGGPADGAALMVSGEFGEMELESITEFGARPEGIEIFHAATGLSRKYTTDPRVPGKGLTGEKITLKGLQLCCGLSAETELYLSQTRGFEHLRLLLKGVELWSCPEITADIEVTFELQTKSVVITPEVEAPGIGACFVPYLSVITDIKGLDPKIEGIQLSALEWECDLDDVRLRGLTVLDRCNWAISTKEYGSELVERWRADAEGIQYYTDYWELLSVEAKGPGCCGEWKITLNAYFGDDPGFFGWSMGYLRLEVPLAEGLRAWVLLQVDTSGVHSLSFGGHWSR